MSLRAFHIFFIVASIVLAVGLGVWTLPRNVLWTVISWGAGGLLSVYLGWFIIKSKHFRKV